MRRLLLVTALSGALALGGCKTIGGTDVTDQTVSTAINTVQQTALRICGFLPAVETVASILGTFVSSTQPIITIANTIANGICNAVKPAASGKRRLGGAATYNGIAINGQFVR